MKCPYLKVIQAGDESAMVCRLNEVIVIEEDCNKCKEGEE